MAGLFPPTLLTLSLSRCAPLLQTIRNRSLPADARHGSGAAAAAASGTPGAAADHRRGGMTSNGQGFSVSITLETGHSTGGSLSPHNVIARGFFWFCRALSTRRFFKGTHDLRCIQETLGLRLSHEGGHPKSQHGGQSEQRGPFPRETALLPSRRSDHHAKCAQLNLFG